MGRWKEEGKKYRRVGPNTAGVPSLLAALNAKLQLKLSTLKTCRTDRGHTMQPCYTEQAQQTSVKTEGTTGSLTDRGHNRQPCYTEQAQQTSVKTEGTAGSLTDRGHDRKQDLGHRKYT